MESCVSGSRVKLDTKGFCIFCLKRGEKIEPPSQDEVATTDNGEGENDEDNDVPMKEVVDPATLLRRRLSRFMPRYLNTTFSFLTAHDKEDAANNQEDKYLNKTVNLIPQIDVSYICFDCSYLVEKICNLFSEMEKAEMELNWKTGQIKNIMSFAKRASTRVKIFKDAFSDSGTQSDVEELAKIEKFRKVFMDKCSSKFRRLQPRIVLKRKGSPQKQSSKASHNNKIPKAEIGAAIFNDAEVQTDPIDLNICPKERCLEEGCKDDDVGAGINDDIAPPHTPEPSTSIHSSASDVVPEENDDSQCSIRIRNIESLLSPTKSISPVKPTAKRQVARRSLPLPKPPVAKMTRGSLRRLPAVNYREDGPVNEDDDETTGPPLLTPQKRVPEVVASLSSMLESQPSQRIQIHDTRPKKATLTEWLQSTFNCDKCNKMFISEATLNVHRKTCGVVEEAPAETENGQDDKDDADYEPPMDISMSDAPYSSDDDDDPLGETEPVVETEENLAKSSDETTTTTLRILRKDNGITRPPPMPGHRYCKYCVKNVSTKHFLRHRQTLQHKQNKRVHKKAKKLGQMTNVTASTSAVPESSVLTANAATSDKVDAPTAPKAIVTVSHDENNVQVVKIIYVSKNDTEATEGTSADNQVAPAPVNVEAGNISNIPAHEVIEISDDD